MTLPNEFAGKLTGMHLGNGKVLITYDAETELHGVVKRTKTVTHDEFQNMLKETK